VAIIFPAEHRDMLLRLERNVGARGYVLLVDPAHISPPVECEKLGCPPFACLTRMEHPPGRGLVRNPGQHALPEDLLGQVWRQTADDNLEPINWSGRLGLLLAFLGFARRERRGRRRRGRGRSRHGCRSRSGGPAGRASSCPALTSSSLSQISQSRGLRSTLPLLAIA
jgi:hypothetical protein